MKKTLSLVLAFVFALCICFSAPVAIEANAADVQGSLRFYLNDDGKSYYVTYYDGEQTNAQTISIPAQYNSLPVTEISAAAFSNCTNLISITIPSSITTIGGSAFRKCTSLTNVSIANGVKSIGNSVFEGCTSLKSIVVPESVEYIGNYAFYDCTSLSSITLGSNIKQIGFDAFYNTAYANNSANWEGGYALYAGKNLISLNENTPNNYAVKAGTVTLADYALDDISDSVLNIQLPATLRYFSYDSLGMQYYLQNIYVDRSNPYYQSYGGVLFNKGMTEIIYYSRGKKETTYTIPASVTSIAPRAFHFVKIKSVTLPQGLVSIGDEAFSYTDLESVSIPDSVTKIGVNAFYGISELTSVSIGKNVKEIGRDAFSSTGYSSNANNWSNGVLYVGNYLVDTDSTLTGNCVIKTGTKLIADYAFRSSTITGVTIPDTVTNIGKGAFYFCSALSSLSIPNTVTEIKDETFYDVNLTTLVIPDSVTSIGEYAFASANNLTTVTIGSGVKNIAAYAFNGCFNLKTVNYNGYYSTWKNISIGIYNDYLLDAKLVTLDKDIVVPTPQVTIKLYDDCMSVDWNDVAIADSYVVYRSTYNKSTKKWSGWTKIAEREYNWYYDRTVKIGVGYRYTVRAVANGKMSGYKASNALTFNGTPKVTVATVANGVNVKWTPICNATGYRVYRSHYNKATKKWTSWKSMGTAKSNVLKWTDKSTVSGTTYRYTVRALNGSVQSSFKASANIIYLSMPTAKIANSAKGVKVSWSKVSGATGYRVYRSEYVNGKWSSWKTMGTAKSKYSSWVDKSAMSGTTYRYAVRAVNSGHLSTYKATSGLLYLAQPTVTVAKASNGIQVNWSQCNGATGYTVYRSQYNASTKKWSSWKSMGTAKADKSRWVDRSAKSGVTYKYTVRAVNGNAKSTYCSGITAK